MTSSAARFSPWPINEILFQKFNGFMPGRREKSSGPNVSSKLVAGSSEAECLRTAYTAKNAVLMVSAATKERGFDSALAGSLHELYPASSVLFLN